MKLAAVAFLVGVLVAPLAAEAQPAGKAYRVGFVMSSARMSDIAGPAPAPYMRAFEQALRDLGYVEGRNLVLGGNVTGLTLDTGPEVHGKRWELLKEAVPTISRVAFIGSRADWESPAGRGTQAAARTLGLTLLLAEHAPTDYAPAFAFVTREGADAAFAALSAPNFVNRRLLIEFAAKARLPASYGFRESVEDGGLMAYGASLVDLFRRAAIYVDKILKGAKPADLPVEQPTKFELLINLKTAKALGLTIPPAVLLRADEVLR